MSSDPGASEADRALAPLGHLATGAPQWVCPECGFLTYGTIDEPYAGDGTCPECAERTARSPALRLARPGDSPVNSGPPASAADPAK
jgi:hypothetical protein